MRRALVVAGLPSSLGFGIAGPSSAKEIVTSETCRDYGDASEPSSTVGLIAPPESDRAQRAPVYGEAGGRARVLEDRRNDQSVRWRGAIHDDSPCTGSATVRAGIDTSLTSEYGADHTVDLPPYGRANAGHGPFIEDTCAPGLLPHVVLRRGQRDEQPGEGAPPSGLEGRERMRWSLPALVLLAALAGCSSDTPAAAPRPAAPSSPATTPGPPTPSPTMTLEPDRAVEQEYARYEPLLPLERREGEHTLVWRSGSYRLFYDCSGGGEITFTKGGRVMGDFPCDGIPGDLQVLTSEGEQEVTVDVKPGIVYKIGVTTAEPVGEPSTT